MPGTTTSTRTALDKYLKVYAETEVIYLHGFPKQKQYQQALLIPCYLEGTDFLNRLDETTAFHEQRVLLVLVSNHPTELNPSRQKQALTTHQAIQEHLGKTPVWHSGNLSLYERQSHDVLMVDRTDNLAIPARHGVGLARKIAADLICALIQSGQVSSPWIMSTDADAILPKDYFNIPPQVNSSAIVFPFQHLCDNSLLGQATLLYEQSILHYVNGLRSAGSEYGFSTLGSCLAFQVDKYAQARGFPKRPAGEDFYLLNKLAKLGKINTSDQLPLIKLHARQSDRVPFGTGPAVSKLMCSADIHAEPLFYHPGIFAELNAVLEQLKQRPQEVIEMQISKISKSALQQLGIEQALGHARKQRLSAPQYDHHMQGWFDGFKTLKFVHYLRDSGREFANLSATELKAYTGD